MDTRAVRKRMQKMHIKVQKGRSNLIGQMWLGKKKKTHISFHILYIWAFLAYFLEKKGQKRDPMESLCETVGELQSTRSGVKHALGGIV